MTDQPSFVPPASQPTSQPVTSSPATSDTSNNKNNAMAITSMILGILSILMFGFGILLGVPAIILGIIALKKKQGEKGFSITGIVTGSISTAFSLFLVLFLVFAFLAASSASRTYDRYDSRSFDSSNGSSLQREV